MIRTIIWIAISCFLCEIYAQDASGWKDEMIIVHDREQISQIMGTEQIFVQRWDILPQAQFWKKIMQLTPDTCLVNIARNRKILEAIPSSEWIYLNKEEKKRFRDSMRRKHELSEDELVYITSGKNEFYNFQKVYPSISSGVSIFDSLGVDPWYAQSILLIESPGQLKKSSAGAYGPFQLMPKVARAQGLIVNRSLDERKDFTKSAYGAAKLLKNICIPETKNLLKAYKLDYAEKDMWFRFLVLHVYHAGAYNVAAVLNKIQPQQGSQELIKEMWQNKAAAFGNCSQNYSQIAIAAHLILHDLIYESCHKIEEAHSR